MTEGILHLSLSQSGKAKVNVSAAARSIIAQASQMGHALHLWTWVCALTGFHFLHLCTAAPTFSTLFQSSNLLDRLPCIQSLTHLIKPLSFPVSTTCTKPTNATLRTNPLDGMWVTGSFALFSMEDLSSNVRTPSLSSISTRSNFHNAIRPHTLDRSSTPYFKRPSTAARSTAGNTTSPPPTTRPLLKNLTPTPGNATPKRPSTPRSNPPLSARLSKTRRSG